MMPKFRAYLKNHNEMRKVKSIAFEETYSFSGDIPPHVTVKGWCDLFPLDEIELMQSTGLLDKNGVEIYEGYEIELTHSDLEGETIYSEAIAKAPMDYTLEEAVALNHAHEIELTGKNIYENPELLEEEA